MSELVDDLVGIVGRDHVVVDADVRSSFEQDWTGRYGGPCDVVVRPADTAEVATVLAACSRHGATVIPQAGNTGLVGGSVPRAERTGNDGGSPAGSAHLARPVVVLSLTRLDQIGPVDEAAMQVTVGAGVTLTRWRDAARGAGLDTPVDFAARDVATVGGAIATNAGGSRVLRYGTMRQQVVGIEAVTADGSIVGSLSGLPKETAGLHWPSLLAGSEGTLAVVTAARVRLVPWWRETITALVALDSLDAALALLADLRRSVPSLDAVELIGQAALDLVSDHIGETAPVTAPDGGMYLMIDCADQTVPSQDLLDVLERTAGVADVAITTDGPQRTRLVAFRDRITEAIASASTEIDVPTFKLDVAVPLGSLAELVEVAEAAAATDGCRLIVFGHLAEGNLHLNHLGARQPAQIAATVLSAVAAMGGTISAEHGIGIAKTPWLHLIRTAAELDAQAAIRTALDPAGTLNPGVLTPASATPTPADVHVVPGTT